LSSTINKKKKNGTLIINNNTKIAGSSTILLTKEPEPKKRRLILRPKGEQTLLSAELQAIKAALDHTPTNQPLTLYTDSKMALTIIRDDCPTNHKTRHKEIIDPIKHQLTQRTAPMTLLHIYSHQKEKIAQDTKWIDKINKQKEQHKAFQTCPTIRQNNTMKKLTN
jgi:ribonuclease HI